MPGETLDEALRAATVLGGENMGVILTHLGENVTGRSEADAVARHYAEMVDRLIASGLDAEVSVKLTQLGLDLSPDLALEHASALAARAAGLRGRFWIDMEGSAYTEVTLDLYRRLRQEHERVGVCLQTYLRRTASDLESLIPMGAGVRLVKGAYDEPPAIAFRSRQEVDEAFFTLSCRLLDPAARAAGAWLTAGTHDPRLIARIEAHADAGGVPRDAFEFALLFGIGRAEQARLAGSGRRVRVLVSYGEYWFPWYMRRLAERPANVGFVFRKMIGG